MRRVLAATMVLCCLLLGCSSSTGQTVVNMLNWGDYIDPEVLRLFEAENPDTRLNMTTTDSNEAMYVSTATEGTQIDVIIPSEYMIQRMMQEDMLAELDHALLPNYEYVAAFTERVCAYDPQGRYSVPYSWGTFGILYNTELVAEDIESWDALFDPRYAGQILMYDSIRDSLGVAFIKLGYDLNTTDPDRIHEAAELLISQKPIVLAYGTDDLRMSMSNGSAAMAAMYAGDAVYAMQDNDALRFVVPKEGADIFIDAMAVLKTTDVYDEALRFINFMMRPDIAALNAAYTGYSTPEDAALPYIGEDILNNNAFLPDDSELQKTDYYIPLPRDVLKEYEYAWLEVKAASPRPAF